MPGSISRIAIVFALLFLGLNSAAYAKKFDGSYLVTIQPNSYCLTFTNTGSISGYANSGTWSSQLDDFSGYFIVSHGKLHLYGTFFVPDNFISADSKLGTEGGFWTSFSGPLADPGSAGTFTMTPGC